MRSQGKRQRVILAALFVVGLGMSPAAYADEDVRGVITARGHDGTLIVRTDDNSSVIVVMDNATRVNRTNGLREMKISSVWLIPGLRVKVEGFFLATNRFAAEHVKFSRSDLRMALAIRARIDPTDQRSLDNQKRIAENAKVIARQQQALGRQDA